MENSTINSLTTIQKIQSSSSIQSLDQKFRQVLFKQEDSDVVFNDSIIYNVVADQFQSLNQKVVWIQNFDKQINENIKKAGLTYSGIEEPENLKVKIAPKIQRSHSQALNRSKSEHTSFLRKRRILSGVRAQRFSNTSNSTKPSAISQKEMKSISTKGETADLSQFNKLGQKAIKKSIQKKVRLRTNSVISLNQDSISLEYNGCIPLKKHNDLEESFWQSAYRLKKSEGPVWETFSKMWTKAHNDKKNVQNKTIQSPKEIKKIVYEGYDFNGQLIASVNLGQKPKKPIDHVIQIEATVNAETDIQKLDKNHERQARKKTIKTNKQRKINTLQDLKTKSEFLQSLEKLQWQRNVEYVKRQQVQETQSKTKNSLKIEQNKNKQKKLNSQKSNQQIKNVEYEELIQEFQKIKFGSFQSQVNQTKNFPFGLPKYVKAKKFQQKLTKSKSYNSHLLNYFSVPYQNLESQAQTTLKRKNNKENSSEKIHGNQKLFKQLFNLSLKGIEPEKKEDQITQNKLQEDHMQNSLNSEKQRESKLIQKSQQLQSPLHIRKHNYRKSFGIPRNSFNQRNLQNAFKKQTKKVLIKQSIKENRRQSFL